MSAATWFYANGSKTVGPMTLSDLLNAVRNDETLVYGPATGGAWKKAKEVDEVVQARKLQPPAPPKVTRKADEVEYEIFGDDTQFVEVILDPGERMIAESGNMMYMDAHIKMETTFSDLDSNNDDLLNQAVQAGKRLIIGESLFMTNFTNAGSERQKVAFAAPYTGKIVPLDLKTLGGEFICQKGAFLCAPRGIELDVAFQKNIGVALFGGEGFIMQRLRGEGLAFIHAGGMLIRKTLKPGEVLNVDTGCVVGYTPDVTFDVEFMKDIKNALFGGEGFSLAKLSGPGDVWLQSLPFSRFAGEVGRAFLNPKSKEEGSLLGVMSGTSTSGSLGAIGAIAGALGAVNKLGRLR